VKPDMAAKAVKVRYRVVTGPFSLSGPTEVVFRD